MSLKQEGKNHIPFVSKCYSTWCLQMPKILRDIYIFKHYPLVHFLINCSCLSKVLFSKIIEKLLLNPILRAISLQCL